jgi:SAM-dependent methyltransferase
MPPLQDREAARFFDENWPDWLDMKVHGPASRWLRFLIHQRLIRLDRSRVRQVLDVGCGEGSTTFFLAGHFPQAAVKGIDVSRAAIAAAGRRYRHANLSFAVEMSPKNLGHRFDLICCLEVLEHVDAWRSLLHEMAAAARHYLMLSFPTGRMRKFETDIGHRRNFRKGEVDALLTASGYRPLDVCYAGFPFYSPFYRDLCNLVRVTERRFVRGNYGIRQKAVAAIFYLSFRYLSTRRSGGDQFVGLFVKQ